MSEDSTPPEQVPQAPLPGAPQGEPTFLQRIHPLTFALITLTFVFLLYQVVAGGVTFIVSGGKVTVGNASFIRWATVFSQLFCILLPTLIFGKLRYKEFGSVFLFKLPGGRQTFFAVVAVFALQQLLQVYMIAQDSIPLPPEIRDIVDKVKHLYEATYQILVTAESPAEFLVVVLTVALVPAVVEEMLFRGLIQRSIGEATGGFRSAIVTGFIFGAYHLNPINIVPLVALGVFFGYLVYRSRNLVMGISAHFFNNFVACAAAYMNVRDDFIALYPSGGGPTVPMLAANAVFFLVVFLSSTYYFIKVTDAQA